MGGGAGAGAPISAGGGFAAFRGCEAERDEGTPLGLSSGASSLKGRGSYPATSSGGALPGAPPPLAEGGGASGAGAPLDGANSSLADGGGASADGGGALLFGASPHEPKATAARQNARTPNLRKAASPNPPVTCTIEGPQSRSHLIADGTEADGSVIPIADFINEIAPDSDVCPRCERDLRTSSSQAVRLSFNRQFKWLPPR